MGDLTTQAATLAEDVVEQNKKVGALQQEDIKDKEQIRQQEEKMTEVGAAATKLEGKMKEQETKVAAVQEEQAKPPEAPPPAPEAKKPPALCPCKNQGKRSTACCK